MRSTSFFSSLSNRGRFPSGHQGTFPLMKKIVGPGNEIGLLEAILRTKRFGLILFQTLYSTTCWFATVKRAPCFRFDTVVIATEMPDKCAVWSTSSIFYLCLDLFFFNTLVTLNRNLGGFAVSRSLIYIFFMT